jgi:hypothetical protein
LKIGSNKSGAEACIFLMAGMGVHTITNIDSPLSVTDLIGVIFFAEVAS